MAVAAAAAATTMAWSVSRPLRAVPVQMTSCMLPPPSSRRCTLLSEPSPQPVKQHNLSKLKRSTAAQQKSVAATGKGVAKAALSASLPEAAVSSNKSQLRLELPETPEEGVSHAVNIQSETLKLLEWPAVCAQVAAFCSTPAGKQTALQGGLKVGSSRRQSERLLAETEHAHLQELDFAGVRGCSHVLDIASSGLVCAGENLVTLALTLQAGEALKHHLMTAEVKPLTMSEKKKGLPEAPLRDIVAQINMHPSLVDAILHCISDRDGTVLDRASEVLTALRAERRSVTQQLEELVQREADRLEREGAAERSVVTRRRGRLCTCLRANRKASLLGGVVLDESNSGATLYMEPAGAVDLNNRELELSSSVHEEETAVLAGLTQMVSAVRQDVVAALDAITALDLACARAKHAAWMGAKRPILHGTNSVATDVTGTGKAEWLMKVQSMRHPLLWEVAVPLPLPTHEASSQQANSMPVPVDITIRGSVRAVSITGPNTGGKTATLKTLGLAAVMAKAGMFLPTDSPARLPWFDAVLADIGDEQSLQQSLSTFSGHVRRLCRIMEQVSSRTLVLLDEVGSGTDPQEGAALASALVKHLAGVSALIVATTHYAQLRALHDAEPLRFENASVEFDVATLRPTYKVLWGMAGRSNALDIATGLGFDPRIVEEARRSVQQFSPATVGQRMNDLLAPLESQREALKMRAAEARQLFEEVHASHAQLQKEVAELPQCEREEKKRMSLEAKETVEKARAQIHSVLDAFKRQERSIAAKDASEDITRIVEQFAATTANESLWRGPDDDDDEDADWVPSVGEQVVVARFGPQTVEVLEAVDASGDVVVKFGSMRMKVDLSEVLRPQSGDLSAMKDSSGVAKGFAITSELRNSIKARRKARPVIESFTGNGFPTAAPASDSHLLLQTTANTVDLRGKRAEEALPILQEAILRGNSTGVLYVIHGFGTGRLKDAVLQELSSNRNVSRHEPHADSQGGCTVASLN
eukprot:jgi/Chlat1/1400/Chrsp12S02056